MTEKSARHFMPAFPGPNKMDQHMGMNLRDYFAGQALAGVGTWMPGTGIIDLDHPAALQARAEWAYAQADAMMREKFKS